MSMMFCRGCGQQIHESAVTCPHCGAPQKTESASARNIKGQTLAAVLAAFLGGIGAHRFYLGKIVSGVLYLLFFWTGIPVIIAAIETYLIAFASPEQWAKKYNNGEVSAPVPGILKFLLLLPALILILAFIFGVVLAIAMPAYKDYTERAKVSEVVLAASSARTCVTELVQSGVSKSDLESCSSEKPSKYVEGVVVFSDGRTVEVISFATNDLIEGGEVILIPTIGRDNVTGWECGSPSIPMRLLPNSCRQVIERNVNRPFRSYSEYKKMFRASETKNAAPAAAAPPVAVVTAESPTPSATVAPTPAIVVPETAANPAPKAENAITPAFTVLAPDESKQLLTSMLQQSASAFKASELKGKIEAIPKPATGDRKTARRLNEQGLNALKTDNYGEAISSLKNATEADPADVEVLNNYVYALIKAKRLPDAEKEAGRLLTLSPGRSSAWANVAEIYALNGNKAEAVAALILVFQFSSNKDKTLTFLNDKAGDSSSPLQGASQAALEQIKKM